MTSVTPVQASPAVKGEGRFKRFALHFASSTLAVFGLIVFLIMLLAAIFAPFITPQNPYDLNVLNIMNSFVPPGDEGFAGDRFLLGSDAQGRDMLSGIIYGLRTSLLVGIGSAIIACAFGASLGLIAGYSGGKVDTFIMRLADLHLSFPTILIALMILAFLGTGIMNVVLAIVIVEWSYYTRIVRATAMVERRKEYIEAAHSLVLSSPRILFRHLLPNCLPPLIVVATIQIARAISLEATLSFLGVGVPITQPSLGLLISNGYQHVISGRYWISFYPGVALLILIVAINLVGDHLREIMNPRNQK